MASAKQAAAGGALIASLAAAFILPNEGVRTHAYRDPAGILTICVGETQGVTPGERRTPAQCREMLMQRIPDYLGPVDRMMPGLPDNRRVAYTDFAYNAGVGALAHSRIPRLERAHHVPAACNELLRYVYAGKKVLPGLVTRRKKERDMCLST